jgi:hypothetical protein
MDSCMDALIVVGEGIRISEGQRVCLLVCGVDKRGSALASPASLARTIR